MSKKKFQILDLTEVKLYDVWDSVGSYNGWLGGTGDNWERAPYFLDGILPLAYYLGDKKLWETAQKYIDWILNSQDEEGNFGPQETKDDWWSRMVALKALIQYYEITKEENVLDFMQRYYWFQLKVLPQNPLREWGKARCADLLYCIKWFYEKRPEGYLLELYNLILSQGEKWNELFQEFPFVYPTEYYYDWRIMEKYTKNELLKIMRFHHTHIVNITMALKYPAMTAWLQKENDEEILKKAMDTLNAYHGVATGMVNGDEHLAGNSPSRGTELCAVVEYMFSLQIILEMFGNPEYADMLERLILHGTSIFATGESD